jgi:hypothetical protein
LLEPARRVIDADSTFAKHRRHQSVPQPFSFLGTVTVTDGPFTEAKEVIGGAWIVETNTKEEAIEIARRVWQIFADVNGPTYVGEGEVRELFGWVNLEASRRERTESPGRP